MTVRGMAYPFGNFNDSVIETIRGLGIEYARTVNDTHNFNIPDDFLQWDPTIHQFGKAYYTPGDTLIDRKELVVFNQVVNDFLKADYTAMMDVWSHSGFI